MQSERIMILGRFPMTCIESVRSFWENNPLWSGESDHSIGSPKFLKNILQSITTIALPVLLTLDFCQFRIKMNKILEFLILGVGLVFGLPNLGLGGIPICMPPI